MQNHLRAAACALALAASVALAGCTSATTTPAAPVAKARPAAVRAPSKLPTYWRSTVHHRPDGPGVVPVESLPPAGALTTRIGSAGNAQVSFGAATYSFSDFRRAVGLYNGVDVGRASGIRGDGVGRTTFAMKPHTSTKRRTIPKRFPQTNQLSLMAVRGDGLRVSGFTLRATAQGHLYNGLRIGPSLHPVVTDLRVVGIPGSSSAPPGETFGVNDYRTRNAVYDRIEVDGHGVGASGFGSNISSDVTVRRSYFHDNPHSMGATFWQDRDVRITDVIAVRNKAAGLNFERVSGSVTITRPITRHNGCCDLRIVSDRGSAKYRIVDPVFDGPKLVIAWPRTYLGHPNIQRRGDIHLIVHGVDRTKDLLRFSVR